MLHLEQSNFRLTEPDFSRLDPYYRPSDEESFDSRKVGYVMDFSLSAILMSSGKNIACILSSLGLEARAVTLNSGGAVSFLFARGLRTTESRRHHLQLCAEHL